MRISWYWPDTAALLNGHFSVDRVVIGDSAICRIRDGRYGYGVCRVDFGADDEPNPEDPEAYMQVLLMGAEIYYQEHYADGTTPV